jgi:hypothetical protein
MPAGARKCPHCGIQLPSARRSLAVQGVLLLAVAGAIVLGTSGHVWSYLVALATAAIGAYQIYLAVKTGNY